MILDASRALQAGNAARFLGYFDEQGWDGFPELRRSVIALLAARTVASSVDVVNITDGTGGKAAKVDWLLRLTPLGGPGDVETRRQTVELKLVEESAGSWRIASFAPIELFRVL